MNQQLGECSPHHHTGTHITKRVHYRHPGGARFVTAMTTTGTTGMRAYLDTLRTAGVRLADELHILSGAPLTIRHRWVPGPTLLEAVDSTSPEEFAAAVAELAGWVRELDGSDARIDTNLANLCLSHGRPVLIDVMPPLIPILKPRPVTLFDELFNALCFDTPVVLDALLGYALRARLRVDPSGARALIPVVQEFVSPAGNDGFPTGWFRTRVRLATRAVRGQAPISVVHVFFSLTSVLGFRQLSEHARRHRLDTVARQIQEWS